MPEQVPANKFLFAGTVPANNHFQSGMSWFWLISHFIYLLSNSGKTIVKLVTVMVLVILCCRGVISTAVPVLVDNMRDYPDYRVVIAGYSLGEGILSQPQLNLNSTQKLGVTRK